MKNHCGGSLAAGGAKPPMSVSDLGQGVSQFPWRPHVPVTPVRPFGIVELDDVCDPFSRLLKVMRMSHLIKPFLLDDAVHTLRYGIVRGLVVLRHADGGIDPSQVLYVLVAAILYATVRMMDQAFKAKMGDIPDTHLQGCHGVGSDKAVCECPPDDLMRERISQQMKVHYSPLRIYIGDVCHPQLVGPLYDHSFYQVLVFPIIMIGICRMTASRRLQREMVLMHQPIEPVTASHLLGVQLLEHQEKLIGTYAGSLGTDLLHRGHDLPLGQFLSRSLLFAHAIITLAALAKQPAQDPDRRSGMPEPKVVYCLAPAFFSRSMP